MLLHGKEGCFIYPHSKLHLLQDQKSSLLREHACHVVTGVDCVGCQDEVKGALQLLACGLVDIPDLGKDRRSSSQVPEVFLMLHIHAQRKRYVCSEAAAQD